MEIRIYIRGVGLETVMSALHVAYAQGKHFSVC
jgi:hypothetical protein